MKEIKKYLESSNRELKAKAAVKALELFVNGNEIDVTMQEIRQAFNNDSLWGKNLLGCLRTVPDVREAVCFVLKPENGVTDLYAFDFLAWAYEKVEGMQKEMMEALRLSPLDKKVKIELLLRYINLHFAAYIKELLSFVGYEVYINIAYALNYRSSVKKLFINDLCLDVLEYYINIESRLFCPIAITKIVPALLNDGDEVYVSDCYERACQIVLQMFEKCPKAVTLIEDRLWDCLLKNQFSKMPAKNCQLLVSLLLYSRLDKRVVAELPRYLETFSNWEGELNSGWPVVQMAFSQRLEKNAEDIGTVYQIVSGYIGLLQGIEKGRPENFDDAVLGLQQALPYYSELVKTYSVNVLKNAKADDDIYKEEAFSMFVNQLFWLGKLTGNSEFTALASAALDELLKQYRVVCCLPWYNTLQDIFSILENVLFEQNQEQLDYVVKMLNLIAEANPDMFERITVLQAFSDFCEKNGITIPFFEERYRVNFERLQQQEAEDAKLLQELDNL